MKEGNITAALGPYIYKTHFSRSPTGAVSPDLIGSALLINGDLSRWGQVEIGVYPLEKYFFRSQNGAFVSERTKVVHIAIGYRRWWNEVLSTAVSFYSAYSLGSRTLVHSDFPAGTEIDTSARDTTEYGFDFSVQTELWSHQRFAVVLNGNYSLSVTEKPGEKSDHYGALLGLRYFIQEKQVVSRPKNRP